MCIPELWIVRRHGQFGRTFYSRENLQMVRTTASRATAMLSLEYSQKFFEAMRNGSSNSAKAVVPRLVSMFSPRSVIDIGCGAGSWLAEFRACGLEDYVGV